MAKDIVKTIAHRSIVAELVYVIYDHENSNEKREFAGVRFRRTLPNGRYSVDFRSADLQDLIDCIDKIRPELVDLEEPIKKRILEAQETKWRQRVRQRARDESLVPLVDADVQQSDE